jgi:hypothetical protein
MVSIRMKKKGIFEIVVVLLLAVSIPQLASAAIGCFTEPSFPNVCSSVDRVTAETFCNAAENSLECLNNFFLEGTDCAEVSLCNFNPGTWCTDTCSQVDFQAQCADRSSWLDQTATPSQCIVGCCICDRDPFVATENVCQSGLNQNECAATCSSLVGYTVGLFDTSFSPNQCTNSCSTFASLPGTVQGIITSSLGTPIEGASVIALTKTNKTDSTGAYKLNNLPVGEVTLTASKPGFQSSKASITVASGQTKVVDITMSAAASGSISGVVKDSKGNAVGLVKITLSGPTITQTLTNSQGDFQSSELPFGTYLVEARKQGFQNTIKTINLDSANPIQSVTITLLELPQAVISGQVVDNNGNPVAFAEILTNGAFATFTAATGFYSTSVFADTDGESYSVIATKAGFLSGAPKTVSLSTAETKTVDIALTSLAGECVFPIANPPVNVNAAHVLGEPSVLISWRRPCKEVRGYIINRSVVQPGIGKSESETIIFIDVVPGITDTTSFTDKTDWQTAYEYKISAVYNDVTARHSEAIKFQITTGNPVCEGKFRNGVFTEFCQEDTFRLTCSEVNQIVSASGIDPTDCSSLGSTVFCAGPDIAGNTRCADTGICSSQSQDANPFGLWFERASCYENPLNTNNFCYFDRTNSILNSCNSCKKVESCFDYRTKDACETNSCLGSRCDWVDSSPELGTGYCVPEDYDKTDHCADCSAQSPLFKNAFCSPEVCGALGACYANLEQSSCTSCSSSSSCYEFQTQMECTGGSDSSFSFGNVQPSTDSCSLGTCSFNSASKLCFKDGNADSIDDCTAFRNNPFHFNRCAQDNLAPITTTFPEVLRVNAGTGSVTFHALDENTPSRVFYCVDSENNCLPNSTNFINYNNRVASLNLASELSQVFTGKGDYFIRFASEDIFFNREDIQSKSFVGDLAPPKFILLNFSIAPDPSGSSITFDLIVNEKATCVDTLKSYNTLESFSDLPIQRNNSWTITYGDMPDGLYRYDVTCTDDFGNSVKGTLDLIDVDALAFIQIITPQTALQKTTFPFTINTSEDSRCDLLVDNKFIETFTTSNFRLHSSTPKSFPTNTFFANHVARCTELSNGEIHEKIIPFTIDQLAPRTEITITSSEGLAQSFTTTGWDVNVNTNATVSFSCNDFPENGFGCKQTNHCVTSPGASCQPTSAGPVPTIGNDSSICFFSTDIGNTSESTKCGIIHITPEFGISIENPSFGVSNKPEFDLVISTHVPSSTCKWAAGDFNFTSLISAGNTFSTKHPFRFEKSNFTQLLPEFPIPNPSIRLHIRCNATTGRISPVEVFEVAFDPTPPKVLNAFADPAIVAGGNSVDLVVETDDRTICKYGTKSTFDQLDGLFPQFAEKNFQTTHRTPISLTSEDDGRTHSYNVICMNRAEDKTVLTPVSFTVNFAQEGTILTKSPTGSTSNLTVLLQAKTNKAAFCEYLDSTFHFFTSTGQATHSQIIGNLSEGAKSFPLRCTFTTSGIIREDQISFTIDRSPPELTAIFDGDATCSLNTLTVNFQATDTLSAVTSYDYEVFNQVTNNQVVNGTAVSSTALIGGLNLTEGAKYAVKAKPRDAAGNIGNVLTSDGVTATIKNATQCQETQPPSISVITNTTRNGVSVTLSCQDSTACTSTNHGFSDTATNCAPTTTYTNSLLVTKQQFICYSATDGAGNNATGGQFIFVPDEDGDGITDPFDECPNTPLGETPDVDGCSSSQRMVDTDGDGLPDNWELQHDSPNCQFDPREPDTDLDGIDDGEADYNNDGTTNREHYLERSLPCIVKDADSDGISDAQDKCPNTPASERTTIINNPESPYHGCGPSERDSDGDGMDDGFENTFCGGDCNPNDDIDGDGLTNLEEYNLKIRYGRSTNPTLRDTDNDGWDDNTEVKRGTNPTDPDSKPSSILAIILLILGIVLIMTSIAYLIYSNKYLKNVSTPQYSPRKPAPKRIRKELRHPLQDLIVQRRKLRHDAEYKRRKKLFSTFGDSKQSPLPDLNNVMKIHEDPDFEKLAGITSRYLKNKIEIRSKLSKQEKDVFEQLELISNKAKGKNLKHILSSEQQRELEDIFKELIRIIREHKAENAFQELNKVTKK